MQVLFAAGLPKVVRVPRLNPPRPSMKSCSSVRATVKTEVRSVMRAAVVVALVAVALCAVCSPGTGLIVLLWSQSSIAGSGVRWWRQRPRGQGSVKSSRAGPKLAGKPVEWAAVV